MKASEKLEDSINGDMRNYTEIKEHVLKRGLWFLVNHTLYRCLKGRPFNKIRIGILRLFGATIDKDAYIYSSCTIFAPWNLYIGRTCVGPHTNLYCKDAIIIGDDSVVSQGTYLCTASHDITNLMLPLKTAPIKIGDHAWVAANAFVGMGVTIGEGAVVGATASVYKDVEAWTVVGGNPAKVLKKREIIR